MCYSVFTFNQYQKEITMEFTKSFSVRNSNLDVKCDILMYQECDETHGSYLQYDIDNIEIFSTRRNSFVLGRTELERLLYDLIDGCKRQIEDQ